MLKNRESAENEVKRAQRKPQSWPGGPAKGVGDEARNIIKTSKTTEGLVDSYFSHVIYKMVSISVCDN